MRRERAMLAQELDLQSLVPKQRRDFLPPNFRACQSKESWECESSVAPDSKLYKIQSKEAGNQFKTKPEMLPLPNAR